MKLVCVTFGAAFLLTLTTAWESTVEGACFCNWICTQSGCVYDDDADASYRRDPKVGENPMTENPSADGYAGGKCYEIWFALGNTSSCRVYLLADAGTEIELTGPCQP